MSSHWGVFSGCRLLCCQYPALLRLLLVVLNDFNRLPGCLGPCTGTAVRGRRGGGGGLFLPRLSPHPTTRTEGRKFPISVCLFWNAARSRQTRRAQATRAARAARRTGNGKVDMETWQSRSDLIRLARMHSLTSVLGARGNQRQGAPSPCLQIGPRFPRSWANVPVPLDNFNSRSVLSLLLCRFVTAIGNVTAGDGDETCSNSVLALQVAPPPPSSLISLLAQSCT